MSSRSPAPRDSSDPTWSRRWCDAGTGSGPWSCTTCGTPARWLDTLARTSWTRSRWCSATCATRPRPGTWWRARRRVYHLAAIGSVPYSYTRAEVLRGQQLDRHPARPGGGAGLPHAAAGAHLDQRDLRHRADRADRRVAPAPGPVAVRGLQDRRRQAGRVLPPELRGARGDAAAVQHLRPAAVHPRGHPAGHHPARHRLPACSSWARWTRPGTSSYVTDTAEAFIDAGRGPGLGGAGRAVQLRPGRRHRDRPAGRGHRRADGRRRRHRGGRPAAAAQGLRGDAAGVRRDQAARAHRLAAAAAPGTRACGETIDWFRDPANLARFKANEYHQ